MNASPTWYKLVAILAVLWNAMGCLAFVNDVNLSAEEVARLSDMEQAVFLGRPAWAVAATGLAAFTGLLGSVGLLIGKKWALPLLGLSLLGIVVQDYTLFFMGNRAPLIGPAAVALQCLILAIGIGLVILVRTAARRDWLR